MAFRIERVKLDKSAGLFRRCATVCPLRLDLRNAYVQTRHHVCRHCPSGIRCLCHADVAFVLPKGLAIYLLALPKGPVGYVSAVLVYSIGLCIQNGMLTSEFVRKTELETDQIAARQIQQTLQPGKLLGCRAFPFYRTTSLKMGQLRAALQRRLT